jgi:uncharacterized membrane protein
MALIGMWAVKYSAKHSFILGGLGIISWIIIGNGIHFLELQLQKYPPTFFFLALFMSMMHLMFRRT